MNKFIRIIHFYLIAGLPFVIACIAWQTIQPEIEINQPTKFAHILWNILGVNITLWFFVLAVLLILLVAVPQVREKTLRWVANIKERDEREEYITGKASRAAYISTISLIIFFLFFSIFSLNVERTAPGLDNKNHLSVSINMDIGLHDKQKIPSANGNTVLFTSQNFSLNTTTILLILLSWQLLIFIFTARKEQK